MSESPSCSWSGVFPAGKAYDRSPCGTGTSAKLACLAADGKLLEALLRLDPSDPFCWGIRA